MSPSRFHPKQPPLYPQPQGIQPWHLPQHQPVPVAIRRNKQHRAVTSWPPQIGILLPSSHPLSDTNMKPRIFNHPLVANHSMDNKSLITPRGNLHLRKWSQHRPAKSFTAVNIIKLTLWFKTMAWVWDDYFTVNTQCTTAVNSLLCIIIYSRRAPGPHSVCQKTLDPGTENNSHHSEMLPWAV